MRLDFIACKYTHFIQYGKTIEYFFAKRIRNFAEIKRISPPNGSHKTILSSTYKCNFLGADNKQ